MILQLQCYYKRYQFVYIFTNRVMLSNKFAISVSDSHGRQICTRVPLSSKFSILLILRVFVSELNSVLNKDDVTNVFVHRSSTNKI